MRDDDETIEDRPIHVRAVDIFPCAELGYFPSIESEETAEEAEILPSSEILQSAHVEDRPEQRRMMQGIETIF